MSTYYRIMADHRAPLNPPKSARIRAIWEAAGLTFGPYVKPKPAPKSTTTSAADALALAAWTIDRRHNQPTRKFGDPIPASWRAKPRPE